MKRSLMSLFVPVFVLVLTLSKAPAQQEVIDGAKKEGEVVVWAHTWAGGKVLNPFKKKYPFLKVKLWNVPGGSREIPNRMIEEGKANRYTPDVLILSNYGLTVIRDANLLRQYESPAHVKRWGAQPKHRFWVNHALSLRVPTYNTRLVRENEAPKSWDDLKDPKWKGRTVISSSSPDTPLLFAYLWREKEGELNWEKSFGFWSQVVKNTKPRVVRGFRAPNELHASGEHALFLLNTQSWLQFREKGAPVKAVSVGRTVGSSWGIAMPKTVPHPNAARLFINYLVSPEGLLRYANGEYIAVLDPEVAKKAKGNVKLKELGIEVTPVPMEVRTPENLRKATRWWASTLGVKRGKKRRR